MNIFAIKHSKSLVFVIVFVLFAIPFVSFALTDTFSGEIVPDDCAFDNNRCGYCDLGNLAQNIINFLIFFAIIVAVLMMVYAGFLYISGPASPSNIEKAHKVFGFVIWGLVLTLAAWLIINTIMTVFLDADFGDWTKLPGC